MEESDTLTAHCSLNFLGSSDAPTSNSIKAVKLQIVLQMEPQMQSMTKIYCRPLDRPASPCSNVDDIEGTPPEEISNAQPLLRPNSAGSS
nr:syncytin-1-like [Macaca nemestrina]